jgi:hypothetical protein
MIDHKDSPYIRALGFLYLRYCCNPRDLWSWFSKYMRDTDVRALKRDDVQCGWGLNVTSDAGGGARCAT